MGLKEVSPWRPRRVDPRNDASHSYPSKTSSEVSQRPLIVSFLLRTRWANPSLLDPLPTIPASLLPPPQNAGVAQSRSFITGLASKDTSNVIYVTDAVFCHFTCLLLPHPSLARQVEKISSLWEEHAIAAVADSAYTLIAEPEDGGA